MRRTSVAHLPSEPLSKARGSDAHTHTQLLDPACTLAPSRRQSVKQSVRPASLCAVECPPYDFAAHGDCSGLSLRHLPPARLLACLLAWRDSTLSATRTHRQQRHSCLFFEPAAASREPREALRAHEMVPRARASEPQAEPLTARAHEWRLQARVWRRSAFGPFVRATAGHRIALLRPTRARRLVFLRAGTQQARVALLAVASSWWRPLASSAHTHTRMTTRMDRQTDRHTLLSLSLSLFIIKLTDDDDDTHTDASSTTRLAGRPSS